MRRRNFIFAGLGVSCLLVSWQDRAHILQDAARYPSQSPIAVPSANSPRSAGDRHDIFSEGDYWPPDPANPDGRYLQRDGLSNSVDFAAHHLAHVRVFRCPLPPLTRNSPKTARTPSKPPHTSVPGSLARRPK